MADKNKYNYKKFDYAGYVNENADKLTQMQNQLGNFDSTFQYDPLKDEGLQKVKSQLESDANVLASKERGRMGNRIGARSSWTDAVSSSVLAEAQKNYSNLIPEYQQKARDNAYNQLLNQYNLLNQQEQDAYNRYINERNLAYDEHTNAANFDYQAYVTKQNTIAAQAQAEADAIKAQLESDYKYTALNAENGTNYVSPNYLGDSYKSSSGTGTSSSRTSSNTGSSTGTGKTAVSRYSFTSGKIEGLRNEAQNFINDMKGMQFTEPELRQLILNNAEAYDIEVSDIKKIYSRLGLDSSWVDAYKNAGFLWWGKGITKK